MYARLGSEYRDEHRRVSSYFSGAQIAHNSNNQVKNWFFWFLFVFVVITLLVECVRRGCRNEADI